MDMVVNGDEEDGDEEEDGVGVGVGLDAEGVVQTITHCPCADHFSSSPF